MVCTNEYQRSREDLSFFATEHLEHMNDIACITTFSRYHPPYIKANYCNQTPLQEHFQENSGNMSFFPNPNHLWPLHKTSENTWRNLTRCMHLGCSPQSVSWRIVRLGIRHHGLKGARAEHLLNVKILKKCGETHILVTTMNIFSNS